MSFREWVETIIKIATNSMFTNKNDVECNNAKRAILFQMLLQCLGNGILDPYIPYIIEAVIKRSYEITINNYAKQQLYNVILCCLANNAQLTLEHMNSLGIIESVFLGILNYT